MRKCSLNSLWKLGEKVDTLIEIGETINMKWQDKFSFSTNFEIKEEINHKVFWKNFVVSSLVESLCSRILQNFAKVCKLNNAKKKYYFSIYHTDGLPQNFAALALKHFTWIFTKVLKLTFYLIFWNNALMLYYF